MSSILLGEPEPDQPFTWGDAVRAAVKYLAQDEQPCPTCGTPFVASKTSDANATEGDDPTGAGNPNASDDGPQRGDA